VKPQVSVSRGGAPSAASIWSVPAALLLHNVEEALMLPRYAARVLALLPGTLRDRIRSIDYVYVALVVATTIPIILALLARRRTGGNWPTYGILLVAAIVLVNVLWHLAAAALLGGYTPGLVTAVAVNLPVMTRVLVWARRERWLSTGALWVYLAIGVMLHGSGLLALFALASFST
jgi:hypothetical protein